MDVCVCEAPTLCVSWSCDSLRCGWKLVNQKKCQPPDGWVWLMVIYATWNPNPLKKSPEIFPNPRSKFLFNLFLYGWCWWSSPECRWNLFGTLMSCFLSNMGWGVPGYMLGCSRSWSLIPEIFNALGCIGIQTSDLNRVVEDFQKVFWDHPHLGWIYQKISNTNLLLCSKLNGYKNQTSVIYSPWKNGASETTGRAVSFGEFWCSSAWKTSKVGGFSVGFSGEKKGRHLWKGIFTLLGCPWYLVHGLSPLYK